MVEALIEDANHKIASINDGTFKSRTETVIYDRKGRVMAELAINDYYYIDSKNIQDNIKKAFIAIEDARFYQHKGVDYKALARAGWMLIKNKGEITQGGSTITQQLVKNVFLTHERTYSRKFEEILIARKLEQMYTKEQILEFYLNNIYFGNGAYGIETASRTYFNKPSKNLTLSEIAFLAGIPNNPSLYNPITHMDNALKRRDLILSKMKQLHFITQEEYEQAKGQKIVLHMPKEKEYHESYAVSFALSSATKLLMEREGFEFKRWFDSEEERKKYWEEYNELFKKINRRIRNGGYTIYTTIDLDKQSMLQESVNKGLSMFQSKDKKTGLYKTQGAAVTIENQTGDVIAIVGGRTQKDVDNPFNRAYLAYRQPGSAIKPIVAYTPAFEKGMLASTTMTDKPIKNGPKNADRSYHGKVTLRYAVEKSFNTIPFRIVLKYGASNILPYLIKMEFSNLAPQDNNPIIAVGGFTYGVTPLEMAGAYSTLARNGEYIRPTGIQKIVDITNTVLYENKHKRKRVYDSGSAYLMTDVLKGVVTKRYATGYGLALKNMPTAGKTGTTNSSKDGWFAGYTPYYTTVVWVGNDIPAPIYKMRGGSYPGRIWKDFMEKIHKGLPRKEFEKPDRISYMYVNPITGEVDKKNNHGWWRKELVPEIYYELQEKRKEEERRRKLEEERRRLERIKELLAEHGITLEEEQEREMVADTALDILEDTHITSVEDYAYVYQLMNEAKTAIEDVVLPEPKQKFYSRYYREVNRLEEERYQLEHPKPVEEPDTEEDNSSTIDYPVDEPNSDNSSVPSTQPTKPSETKKPNPSTGETKPKEDQPNAQPTPPLKDREDKNTNTPPTVPEKNPSTPQPTEPKEQKEQSDSTETSSETPTNTPDIQP
jgi:penicillin-binding protein 4